MTLVQGSHLGLSRGPLTCSDMRWTKPLANEHARVVEIHQFSTPVERQRGDREWKPSTLEHAWREALTTEPGQLLDDGRRGTIGKVEATVEVGVVVAAFTLERTWKPQRSVGSGRFSARVPGEAPIQDHANASERSALIARINSSVLPARMRSIGRRSPSAGLKPKSQASAASRS